MKKAILFFALQTLIVAYAASQDKYTADTEQSKLLWLGEKVTGQHTGTINLQSGWLTWKDNKIVAGEFLVDMASIKDTEANARLEGHLKSDDFFGTEKYPVSKLVITGSTPFDKGTGVISGTLTIKGISNKVEFKAALQKQDSNMWFYSNLIIDRTLYNIRYGSGSFFDNLGDKTIFDEFKLKISLLVKK